MSPEIYIEILKVYNNEEPDLFDIYTELWYDCFSDFYWD